MPASAAPNSRRTGSRSLCSLRISLTLLRGHTLENIWRGRPCRVCGHFEPKKSAKLELRPAAGNASQGANGRCSGKIPDGEIAIGRTSWRHGPIPSAYRQPWRSSRTMTPEPNDMPAVPIGIDDIVQAAKRLEPWAHRTPVLTSRTLDERSGAGVFLKCENLQRVGAFKFRGAMNAPAVARRRSEGGGSGHPFLGQPCPGPGAGGSVARRAGDDRDAPDGAGGQASGHRWLRRADRALRADSRVAGIDRGCRESAAWI